MDETITGRRHPTRPDLLVAEDGRIFQEVTASPSEHGYATVKHRGETIRRHTLVCEAYHGMGPPGHGVRHVNGVDAGDVPGNLAWGTQRENMADAVRHGTTTRGSRNAQAKLTEESAREIKRRALAGESGTALAREFNISQPSVSDIKAGRTWGHLT